MEDMAEDVVVVEEDLEVVEEVEIVGLDEVGDLEEVEDSGEVETEEVAVQCVVEEIDLDHIRSVLRTFNFNIIIHQIRNSIPDIHDLSDFRPRPIVFVSQLSLSQSSIL